jgi:uncharacterized protein (TIRG00374 family)
MNRIGIRMDWRRWLLLAVFVALTVWVVSRFTNLKELSAVLSQGDWPWLAAAVLLHVAYFVMSAKLYQLCFDVVGVQSDTWHLLPVLFTAFFVNTVIPSGGAAAAAIFVGDAVRRGQSGARTAVGTLLVLLVDLSTLIPFVFYGIAFLYAHNLLRIYDSVTSGIFVLFILLMILGLFLAKWKPNWLGGVLGWVRRAVNKGGDWFRHPDILAEDWPDKNARDLADAAGAIVDHPRKLGRALVWATAMHVVNLVGLYTLFFAFRQSAPLGAVIAGFAMGIVFFVITIFPQGVAAVEGIMSLVFTSEGIPAAETVAIVLAFRAVNFYLPLIFGFFLLQYLSRFGSEKAASTDNGSMEFSANLADDPQEESE